MLRFMGSQRVNCLKKKQKKNKKKKQKKTSRANLKNSSILIDIYLANVKEICFKS